MISKNIFKPIGPFIDQLTGFPFESTKFNRDGRGIRLLRGINISKGRLRFDKDIEMFWEGKDSDLTKYLLKENDIVISMDGSLVGRNYSKVSKDFLPLLLVQRVARLRSKENLNQNYLYQWFNSEFFIRYVDSVKTSSGIPHISSKQINEFKILFPSLEEQIKIAQILTVWDDSIVILKSLILKKDLYKKALMQQLFTGKKRFKEFKKEKWKELSIQDIATVFRGSSPRPKGDPRYYGGTIPRLMVQDVTRDGKYVFPKIDFLTEAGALLSRPVPKGTLVLVCSGDIGIPSILGIDACIHDGFIAFRDIDPNVSVEFLYYLFTRMKDEFNKSATHGGVFTNLTTTGIKEQQILLPSITEQIKIVSVISNLDEEIQALYKQLKHFQNQKNGLMQILLTGKKRVKA